VDIDAIRARAVLVDGIYEIQPETHMRAGARIVIEGGKAHLEHKFAFEEWSTVRRRGHGVDEMNRALQDMVLAAFDAGAQSRAAEIDRLTALVKVCEGALVEVIYDLQNDNEPDATVAINDAEAALAAIRGEA
jgi:hypothetical protein